ncbi:MAG TPA: hypothetical protein VGM50_22230 [Gemmatimonadaceae bacterium]
MRSVWVRLFVGLWAVWFNAALLEAPGVHTCAVHSGVAGASHSHAAAGAPMRGHAVHDASMPSPKDDACACTCLGMCCGVSPFVPTQNVPTIAEHYATLFERRIGRDVVAPHVDRPFDRPFANGPPSLV